MVSKMRRENISEGSKMSLSPVKGIRYLYYIYIPKNDEINAIA